jgi:hexosaminidase
MRVSFVNNFLPFSLCALFFTIGIFSSERGSAQKLFDSKASASKRNPIIPEPVQIDFPSGKAFQFEQPSTIYFHPIFSAQAGWLKEMLQESFQLNTILQELTTPKELKSVTPSAGVHQKKSTKKPKGIYLVEGNSSLNKPEMYQLLVHTNAIELSANDLNGMVNAIASLQQYIHAENKATVAAEKNKVGLLLQAAPVAITDYPAFSYRGMHLDVVRHIFPMDYLKKYVQYLAVHKMNVFHLHLTDDQGWRMESKKYPLLNSIGSYRDSTLIGHFKDTPARYELKRYGGFYTQEELKELVRYAAIRGITIVPEIDIPGHSRATIAAYPAFSTHPDSSWSVAATWGMYNRQNNVLAPRPETFTFLQEIFEELTSIFPSEYIHLGGDECSKKWWKEDPFSQEFIQKNDLKNETGLQTYFVEFVANHLKKLGRKAVGWHELAEGNTDTTTMMMNWADDKKALEVALKGYRLIQTPGKPFYFDHYQSKNPQDSLAIHGYNPLEAVYHYQIIPESLKKQNLGGKVAGGQANVWTEYMEWSTKVDYMIFPRMTALSENLWGSKKNYPDFLRRLENYMIPLYQSWNSSYFPDYKIWTAEK